mgnify:CR=1 FL=1
MPRDLRIDAPDHDRGQHRGDTAGGDGGAALSSAATPVFLDEFTNGYVRELELRASMAQIGLADVRFLPYRDSGMAGTPENDDPRFGFQMRKDIIERLFGSVNIRRRHHQHSVEKT